MPGMKDGQPIKETILMAVVYDPKTGHIAHYHRVHIFDAVRQISQSQVEERARSLASRHGWDVAKLETLSVDASKLKRGVRYKVDVKSHSLVEIVESKKWVGKSPLRRKP